MGGFLTCKTIGLPLQAPFEAVGKIDFSHLHGGISALGAGGKQWYFCQARQKYQKTLFADRAAIRRAKPDSRLCDCVRFVQTFCLHRCA